MPPVLLLLLLLAVHPGLAAEPGSPYRAVEHPGTLSYLIHLPDGYETAGSSFPLLLFLHGIAQKGDGSRASLERVADDGPFRTMRDGRWDESLPLIVVGPQSTGLQPWWQGSAVRRVLTHVMRTYRVNPDRRYVSGISMGGRGAWWLAKNFSDEFAAMVPVSAWAGDVSRSCEVFRGMGIWAFHGDRDPLIRLGSGRKPIDGLNGCEPPLSPSPQLTVLPDTGHGQWSKVYANDHGDTNAGPDGRRYRDIYRWMLSFER